jgi:C4-dicarboxylate-specific signal transduction histidine kinase
LGAGGPELRIRLLERDAYSVPAEHEPTRVLYDPPPAMHEPTRVMHEPTRIVSGPATTVYSSAQPNAQGATARYGYPTEAVQGASTSPRNLPSQSAAGRAAEGESMSSLEDKLKTIRYILVANLAILVVLLVWIFVQGRELAENRDELQKLRAQAENAVTQLTPALDARLGVFENRMDGMDAKIADAQARLVKSMDAQTKHAEDRMVDRMNTAIPAMLDKYIAGKIAELKR